MDALTANYLTHGKSEKQQKRESKTQQKKFLHSVDRNTMFTETERAFLQFFNNENTEVYQQQFDLLAQFFIHYKSCYKTSKYDIGKLRVKLKLHLKTTAIFRKQHAIHIPLQLQGRVQYLLDNLTQFYKIARVRPDSITLGSTFITTDHCYS